MSRPLISAIIITKNEEKNIGRCLSSIYWVDEIVVIDSESSDNTVSIARNFTPNVFIHPWQGYGQQKNLALRKANGKWVLSIDSDEVVDERLKREIMAAITEFELYDGFYIPRKNFIGARFIRFGGWYPDYTLRLFKRNKGMFEIRHVHEAVRVDGKIGYLKNPLLHYTYRDLQDYIIRQDYYAHLACKEMYDKGKRVFTFELLFHPAYNFIKCYIFRRGFMDGYLGLMLAIYSSGYVFKKYAYLKDMKKRKG